jgi:polyvinyl alcohol dehydrogenase (cytochrome)
MCATPIKAMTLEDPSWNGWGRDPENTRRQHEPGFAAKDIPKLKVKWAFAFPNVAYVQPTPVGGNLFAPSRNGTIFALDGSTGCTYWTFKAEAAVRTAVTIGALPDGKRAAYFADEKGNAYAIDAMTGAQIWKTQVDKHVMIRVVGAPKLYGGLLYVPTSSMEEVAAGNNPKYPCCTFRGSVVAVNAETGAIVWTAHTITDAAKPTQKNDADTQMFGPAGGAVWTSPTVDIKRGLLYVGTGDSYTDVPADGTNAIIAFDMKTGERKWVHQVLAKDNWLMGCPPGAPTKGNCPKTVGPDLDFGSPPILKTLPGGKQVLLAVAKGGTAFAFDPDNNGEILWRTPLGEGNAPGVVWGPAVDDENLYVAMTDPKADDPNQGPGGMFAINIKTGKVAWHTPAPKPICAWGADHCVRSQSSAIALITGAVFSGSADGHFRAYDTKTGKLIWDLDVGKTYPGVNGAEAHGGSIDGSPISIAGGTIYLNSGNVTLSTPQPGNALLALTVDGK